jgi:hypothetical protein
MSQVSRICGHARRGVPNNLLVVLAIVVLGSVQAGCGGRTVSATGTAGHLDFGQFAGYQQVGRVVSSVSATLTVPRASPGVHLAGAGTWVGAEAFGPNGLRIPFIQAGVNEIAPGGHRSGVYYAFWTDTARGFRPVPLFLVGAGDRVSARLTLSRHHWTVSISDKAIHRRIFTAQEGRATFQAALWLQEDITANAHTHRLLPYPKLAPPRLSNLSVDGEAPAQPDLTPAWMSIGDTLFKPTALRHDEFSVVPGQATLSVTNAGLLRKLRSENEALLKPLLQLARATGTTPRSVKVAWASELASGAAQTEDTLRQQRWPRSAKASVKALLNTTQGFVRATRSVGNISAADYTEWRTRWSASVVAMTVAAAQLLRSVDLPEIPLNPTSS